MASSSPTRPALERHQPTLGVVALAAELGMYRRSVASIVEYVTGLEDRYGFPSPLPLLWRGKWHTRPHPHSRWTRAAVEAWFANGVPPASAAADDAERRTAGRAMDDAATRMFAPANDRAAA